MRREHSILKQRLSRAQPAPRPLQYSSFRSDMTNMTTGPTKQDEDRGANNPPVCQAEHKNDPFLLPPPTPPPPLDIQTFRRLWTSQQPEFNFQG